MQTEIEYTSEYEYKILVTKLTAEIVYSNKSEHVNNGMSSIINLISKHFGITSNYILNALDFEEKLKTEKKEITYKYLYYYLLKSLPLLTDNELEYALLGLQKLQLLINTKLL